MKTRTLQPKVEQKLNCLEYELVLSPTKSPRDHFMYDLFYKKQKIGIFQISYTSNDFGKPLIGKMARQLGISSQELIGLEKCTFWGIDFVKVSRIIPRD